MENQVITPSQNNQTLPQPPPAPSPAPQSPISPPPAPVADWNTDPPSKFGSMGRLSLLLSSVAVGIFILLIFVTSLVDSLSKAYIWFFVILALGVAGLALGLISEKKKEKISLVGLLGIILSVIVCINCLVVGSYYIKLQMALNDFKDSFNSAPPSQDFNSDYLSQ